MVELHSRNGKHDWVSRYQDFYRAISPYYDRIAHRKDSYDDQARVVFEMLGHPKRVLEVGVGTGNLAVAIARMGCDVVGVDVSPHMLALAEEKVSEEHLPIELVQGSAASLPFTERQFDAVISFGGPVLVTRECGTLFLNSYLLRETVGQLMSEIAGCLHPEGRFAVNIQEEPQAPLRVPFGDGWEYELQKHGVNRTTGIREHRVIKGGRPVAVERYRVKRDTLTSFERLAGQHGCRLRAHAEGDPFLLFDLSATAGTGSFAAAGPKRGLVADGLL